MGFFDDLNSQLRNMAIKAAGADEHIEKIKKKIEPIQQTQKEYQNLKNTVKSKADLAKQELSKITKTDSNTPSS